MLESLCMPALIYLIYGTTIIIIDMYKGLYNQAFVQVWVTLLFTLVLNILCKRDLTIISWIFISIPFLFMTVVAGIILFVFGLNPSTGKKVYLPAINPTSTAVDPAGNPLPVNVDLKSLLISPKAV
jgi:hypothetical protein